MRVRVRVDLDGERAAPHPTRPHLRSLDVWPRHSRPSSTAHTRLPRTPGAQGMATCSRVAGCSRGWRSYARRCSPRRKRCRRGRQPVMPVRGMVQSKPRPSERFLAAGPASLVSSLAPVFPSDNPHWTDSFREVTTLTTRSACPGRCGVGAAQRLPQDRPTGTAHVWAGRHSAQCCTRRCATRLVVAHCQPYGAS